MNYLTKFRSEKNKKMKKLFCTISFILFALIATNLQSAIPDKPFPPRLVNDYATVFTRQQIIDLETKLIELSNSTKTQITIVTVNTLDGETPATYAFQVGEKWGVGDAKFDNGIVILYKPKMPDSKGEVFIATGYGLEGVVPDAIAKRIVEVEMIPEFKKGNYYGGIDAAVNTLISLSKKEFTAKDYEKKHGKKSSLITMLVLLFIGFIFIISSFQGTRKINKSAIGRSNLPFWVLLGMLGSSNRSSGSFGNFSSGGGSFGGGGSGGFGGFGGGSFGGGGAGGSW